MFFEIDPNSQVPLYMQLTQQIKQTVVSGQAIIGQTLPSVRSLASDLGVNMHTVNKAYNLLVDEGVLSKNQQGYSIYLNKVQLEAPIYQIELKEQLRTLMIDGVVHGVTPAEFTQWANDIAQELKQTPKER